MNERDVQATLEVLLHSDVWIGDDGEPLDYLPEREDRIGTLAHELAALVAQARSDALREAAVTMSGVGSHRDPCRLPDTPCLCRLCDFRAAAAEALRAAASSHPTGNQP